MSKVLAELSNKEITRREFLIAIGMGIMSLFGFAGVLKLITGKSPQQHLTGAAKKDYGYKRPKA